MNAIFRMFSLSSANSTADKAPVINRMEKLDKYVVSYSYGYFPGYKGWTRSAAKKASEAAREFQEEQIRETFEQRPQDLDKLIEIRGRVSSTADSILNEKSKTKQKFMSVLSDTQHIESTKLKFGLTLEACKDPNVEILFRLLRIEDVEKPDLSSSRAEVRATKIFNWLHQHGGTLAQISSLTIPADAFITDLPKVIFQFLPGLVNIDCSNHRLKTLPPELATYCPQLQNLNVIGNFLVDVPAPLAHLVDLEQQKQNHPVIYDTNAAEFLSYLKVGALQKPNFATLATEDDHNEVLLSWLVQNRIALSCVSIIKLPAGSTIKALPLGILQYLCGLTHCECPHARLSHLPENLLDLCPELTTLLVEGNCLTDVPTALVNLVDLSVQRQKIPMNYDRDADLLFNCIPLIGKPSPAATSHEKTTWLHQNQSNLEKIISLDIPFDLSLRCLSPCILQYLPCLKRIACPYAELKNLPENLLEICLELNELEVVGNFLTYIPDQLKHLVDLSEQRQRIPMHYDDDINFLLNALPLKKEVPLLDEEKTIWLLTKREELANITQLILPVNAQVQHFPPCLFQFLSGLTMIDYRYGNLRTLSDRLRDLCPHLNTLLVRGNALDVIPENLTDLVDLSLQVQRIPIQYDEDMNILFDWIPLNGKPDADAPTEDKTLWLLENHSKLEDIHLLELPFNARVKNFPDCFFQFFPQLKEISYPYGELAELSSNLKTLCPYLNRLNVEGNFLHSVPSNLTDLVDLSSQKQRIPMVYDDNFNIWFHHIPLLDKLVDEASGAEKTDWLLMHREELKGVLHLVLPVNSGITQLPSCFFQYFPGLEVIKCPLGNLTEISETFKLLCPRLKEFDVRCNCLQSVPENLRSMIDLSSPSQKQRIPMLYDADVDNLLKYVPLEERISQEATAEEKTAWLLAHREELAKIERLVIPFNSRIQHFSSCFFQFFHGLTDIDYVFGDLRDLPEDLIILCPNLKKINVRGNSLESIPKNLNHLVDFSLQKQKIKIDYDDNFDLLFNCLSFEKGTLISSEEKIAWLFANHSDLSQVTTLIVPPHSSITHLPSSFFQFFPKLTRLDCAFGKLTHLPEDLGDLCPNLSYLNVEGNLLSLPFIPTNLTHLVNLSSEENTEVRFQQQTHPLVFEDCITELSEKKIIEIEYLLHNFITGLMHGTSKTKSSVFTSPTKSSKQEMKNAVEVLLGNSSFTQLSSKQIFFALHQNPGAFSQVILKMREVLKKFGELKASEFFKEDSKSLPLIEQGITSIKTLSSKINSSVNQLVCCLDSGEIGEIKTIFNHLLKTVPHFHAPLLTGNVKQDGVIIVSWLRFYEAELDKLSLLDLSKCVIPRCPTKFLQTYFKQVNKIQCRLDQMEVFLQFATENGLVIEQTDTILAAQGKAEY